MKRVWLLLVLSLPSAHAHAQDCAAAAAAAEREFGLPSGLLAAIGQVESGRRDPVTGQLASWPWTTDAQGAGAFWPSQLAAVTAVQAMQAQGMRSIDVGCFQVNLLHHPNAFASLDEAFDPAANGRYAARFLVALQQRTGSWPAAVMSYHSATPELGGPYRDRVLANWGRGDAPGTPVANGFGIHIWTPSVLAQSVIHLSGVEHTALPKIVLLSPDSVVR